MMTRNKLMIGVICLFALDVSARGSNKPDLSFRVVDETVPAGAIVQMKVVTTEVTPISGGRPRFSVLSSFFEGVAGIGMFAPDGELAGAAVVDGNQVALAYVTTTPFTGDYPVLTVALRTRQDAAAGSSTQFTLDPSSLWTLNGATVNARVSPGIVTIGGSVAISDVIPGEGSFPAGTVVSVRGVGFRSGTRLRLDDFDIGSVQVVSSTEIRCTLLETANLTAAKVRVDNPDGSRSIYYSYMRGIPAATSVRALLAMTHPIFSGRTRTVSTFGPIPAMNQMQYAALAIQNPNLSEAGVTVQLYAADGSLLDSSERSLPNGYRLTLEVSELLNGVPPPPGASVVVSSTLPIEVFGLLCDEIAWTVTPRLPIEAASP